VLDEALNARDITTALSARTYIKNMLEKFEKHTEGLDGPIRNKECPMKAGYHPESEITPLLSDQMASKFRGIIGSLNWVVTLGRFDIMYAVNTLARFGMAPRSGHLEAAKHIIGYLKKHPDHRIPVNPNYFDTAQLESLFKYSSDWKEFYPDAIEEMPDKQPDPVAKKIRLTIFVDADHAHCEVTRRSVSGIIVFVNSTPVKWYSKMQNTVETSTYGSELVAARIATEIAIEYRYLCRMLGHEIDGPTTMLGDNNAVVLNTTVPSSQLKKKHAACSYHRVREAIAAKIVRFCHINSEDNIADVLTKPLVGTIHHRLISPVMHPTEGDGVPHVFKLTPVDLKERAEAKAQKKKLEPPEE
jgi:hypothetical protein